MKLTEDELLAIIDEVTIALGQILLSHRQLTEGLLDNNAIEASQDRIEKRRADIEKEREKIRKTRDAIRRRRELEKIRKDREKEANSAPQTEAKRNPAGVEAIINQRGQVIGYRQTNGRQTVFLSPKGEVVAREVGGQTYDRRGGFVGQGKQGLRLLSRG